MEYKIDLHVHTTASDGSLKPDELVRYAYGKGFSGSDFHGSYKPDIDIGVGYGNLKIPTEIVFDLKRLLNMSQ